MKKKLALTIAIIVVLSVVFFPMTTTHSISGSGDILTPQKKKIGTCELEIEIKEVSEFIYDLNYDKDTLVVTLAAGEKTLRIDKFIEFINKNFDKEITSVDVLKIAQILDDGEKTSADDYMKKLTL